jgi:probable F420-dependent oxidoreductase
MMAAARAVKVGVVLPSREAVIAGHADPGLLIEVAERAERAGFDSVWTGDSLFHRPRFDPLAMLAAVAARTHRVEIGTAVLIASQRHPLLLAQTVATLDRIASGRLVLGVGAGWIPLEFEALGVPFGERVGRLRDTIAICRALWRGETPPRSRYWQLPALELLPRPKQPGGPPIWMGGSGPQALRNAGRHCDGWMPTSPTPEAFAAGWREVRRHAEQAGRDPDSIDTGAYLTIHLTDDLAAGEKVSAAYAQAYYGIPYEVMRRGQAYFVGDVPACLSWLGEFVRAGVRHLMLRFATTEPLPQLERARELLPAIARL